MKFILDFITGVRDSAAVDPPRCLTVR